MEEGLAQRSQGFLLLLLLLKCSGICCFSSGFVACGLLGTPGDLSVYLLFILMAPWDEATSPGGGGGGSAVTRDSTPTCFSSPQSMAFLLAEVTLTTETATAAETCSKRASRDTRWASPSPSKGLLLPSSPCSFVWVQEEADVSLAVCSPSLPLASAHLHLHVKITFLGSQTDVCTCVRGERPLSLKLEKTWLQKIIIISALTLTLGACRISHIRARQQESSHAGKHRLHLERGPSGRSMDCPPASDPGDKNLCPAFRFSCSPAPRHFLISAVIRFHGVRNHFSALRRLPFSVD